MFGARFFGARHYGRRFFGKAGLTIPGTYFGGRFFSARMFGERYWSADPGPASTTAGTLFGGRYWGIRHFGRRYFGTKGTPGFSVASTAAMALSGSLTLGSTSFVYGADKALAQAATLAMNATLGISGQLSFDSDGEFSITPPLDLPGMTGNLLLAGDVVISTGPAVPGSYWGRSYWGNRFFGGRYFGRPPGYSIAATAGLGLTGTLGVAGGIATTLGLSFAPMGMAGQLQLLGDLAFGIPPPPNEPPRAPSGGGGGRRGPAPALPSYHRLAAAKQIDVQQANAQLMRAVSAIVMSGVLD